MSNEICSACGKARKDVKQLIELSRGHFWACNECIRLWADICGLTRDVKQVLPGLQRAHGRHARRAERVDIHDIDLPKTTKEFAQYLRDIADQVERIPDKPLQLDENAVEIGFYYGNPMFPQMPTGLHFAVDFASTELTR
jgi:hypothetical protein